MGKMRGWFYIFWNVSLLCWVLRTSVLRFCNNYFSSRGIWNHQTLNIFPNSHHDFSESFQNLCFWIHERRLINIDNPEKEYRRNRQTFWHNMCQQASSSFNLYSSFNQSIIQSVSHAVVALEYHLRRDGGGSSNLGNYWAFFCSCTYKFSKISHF